MRHVKEAKILFNEVEQGRYLFHYSDKGQIYFIKQKADSLSLELIVTTKDFEILYRIVYGSSSIFYNKDIKVKWYRPFISNGTIKIRGKLSLGEEVTYFTIDETKPEIDYEEPAKDTEIPESYSLLSSMEDIKVVAAIQRKNSLYFIGEVTGEDGVTDYAYGEVDMVSDKMDRFYYLDSDKGKVIPTSIDLDIHSTRVSVVGGVLTEKEVLPYIETFLYRG